MKVEVICVWGGRHVSAEAEKRHEMKQGRGSDGN